MALRVAIIDEVLAATNAPVCLAPDLFDGVTEAFAAIALRCPKFRILLILILPVQLPQRFLDIECAGAHRSERQHSKEKRYRQTSQGNHPVSIHCNSVKVIIKCRLSIDRMQ